MSFVGTRPEAVKYVKKYKAEYMATLLLPAGMYSFYRYGIATIMSVLSRGDRLEDIFSNVNSIAMIISVAIIAFVYKVLFEKMGIFSTGFSYEYSCLFYANKTRVRYTCCKIGYFANISVIAVKAWGLVGVATGTVMMASARVLSPSQICWYHSLSRN